MSFMARSSSVRWASVRNAKVNEVLAILMAQLKVFLRITSSRVLPRTDAIEAAVGTDAAGRGARGDPEASVERARGEAPEAEEFM
jgi:hypothetical protein